ncbi:MAG: MFS transporter [Phycisphaerales bacterium JB063]
MLAPLIHYLRGFAPSRQPAMARPGYRRELISFTTLPFATALIEGSVIAVLAKMHFDVGDFGFATITAAPMFANITSGVWARLMHGRRKATMLALIQGTLMLLIGSIALLPADKAGAAMLVGLVVVARCLIAGMLNVRSVIWRANYRRDQRARITGRFTVLMSLLLAVVPFTAYSWLNDAPERFRIIYPIGAAIGLISVLAIARLRVRREKSLIDFERQKHTEPFPDKDPADTVTLQRESFLQVLRRDHLFRRYMTWQFIAGMANMAGNVAVVRLIIGQVEDRYGDQGYGLSTLLTATLPMVMMTLSVPFWARLLDGLHIVRFRVRHGIMWIVCQTMYLLAGLTGNPLMFIVPRLAQGITAGGGSLAWQLGHHDFADRRLAATYMGIHQTLTGVRGVVAPYLGVLLLAGWGDDNRLITWLGLPAFHGIGPWVFALTAAGSVVAWLGFVQLTRQIEDQ